MKEKLKNIRKSRIFSLMEILIFIAVCIGIGVAVAYVRHESDPTEQAVRYFRAFMQKDYEKMYNYVDQDEGYYLNKDMYVNKVKSIRESMTIDSYNIKEPEKKDGKYVVTIECTDTDSGKSENFDVYLNAKRNGIQMVPNYYINIDALVTKNFSVVMNEKNYLELNGETITEEMADVSSDGNGNVTYVFEGIITGSYKVCAVNDYGALVKNIELSEKDTKVELVGTDYTANDKYSKLLSDNGSKFINLFYKAVRNRKPSHKKLAAQLENNKKLIKKVKKLVEESEEIVYWPETKNIDRYTVKDMKMNDLKSSIKYDEEKKQYVVRYTYTYHYTSATDTALYNSYVYTLSGSCKSVMTLTYQIKEDKVVLSDIKLKNKNSKEVASE